MASTERRNAHNYREHKQTVDVDRQSLGFAKANNDSKSRRGADFSNLSFHSNRDRTERLMAARKAADYADSKIVRLNERITKYAKKKQEMLE